MTLIHNDFYMLHIFDELRDEIPEFKAFLEYGFENKKPAYVEEIKDKAVPLKELFKELFSPQSITEGLSAASLVH